MVSSMSGVNLANNTTEECMKQGCVSVMLWETRTCECNVMGLRECQRCMDGQGNWILNGVFIQGSHKKLERKGILQHDCVHKRTGDKNLYGEN